MSKQWCHEVSKTFALECVDLLRNKLPDISIIKISREYFADDEMGTVDTVDIEFGADKATLVLIFGDIDSEDGPYDGMSWIIVESRPWWRPWNKLPQRLNSLITGEIDKVND